MFFVCIALIGLMACTPKQQDKFKNLSADEFEDYLQKDSIQLSMCGPLPNIRKDTSQAASTSMYWTNSLLPT